MWVTLDYIKSLGAIAHFNQSVGNRWHIFIDRWEKANEQHEIWQKVEEDNCGDDEDDDEDDGGGGDGTYEENDYDNNKDAAAAAAAMVMMTMKKKMMKMSMTITVMMVVVMMMSSDWQWLIKRMRTLNKQLVRRK